MSPLPSPTPLRRALLRALFSPIGLLCGFVVLIIVTCPGARGDEAISVLLSNGGLNATTRPVSLDALAAAGPVAPSRVVGRSTRFDRVPVSSARSKTPAERAAETGARPATGGTDDSTLSPRSPLPLLGDALTDRPSSAGIVPMTGPAVGIRPKMPTASVR